MKNVLLSMKNTLLRTKNKLLFTKDRPLSTKIKLPVKENDLMLNKNELLPKKNKPLFEKIILQHDPVKQFFQENRNRAPLVRSVPSAAANRAPVTIRKFGHVLETFSTENMFTGKYAHTLIGIIIFVQAQGTLLLVVCVFWVGWDDSSGEEPRFRITEDALKERCHGCCWCSVKWWLVTSW